MKACWTNRGDKKVEALKVALAMVFVGGVVMMAVSFALAQEEKTYTITLQKTAGIAQQVREVGNKKVLAEPHKVKEGEHIWQILREKGLLKGGNLPLLLSTLKELNSSLRDLDLIHPGQEILIPLKIVPIKGIAPLTRRPAHVKATIVELGGMKLENYTIQPGDSVIKVIMGKYNLPPARLYTEYLQLVRKLNPDIKDLNRVYPGQKIRLPIYSPEIVRKPIKKEEKPRQVALLKGNESPSPHVKDLKDIFLAIGEEWKDTGEHFIPLRSGGQIDLKASSFPLISFISGRRIILDAYHKLPDKVSRLIEQTWPSYRVVHLEKGDDLRKVLNEIFADAGYIRVLGQEQPLEMDGPVPISVTGDWVLVRANKPLEKGFRVVVLTLGHNGTSEGLTKPVISFLETVGIKIVTYPFAQSSPVASPPRVQEIPAGHDPRELVVTILRLRGFRFRENVEIPVMGNEKSDFNLVIKADLFLKVKGHEGIIDLSGLEKDVLSFLREHEFNVLQLAGKKDPEDVLASTLAFLGVPFERGVHTLVAPNGTYLPRVKVKVPGIVFADKERKAVFATPISLSAELKQFLAVQGFHVLRLRKW